MEISLLRREPGENDVELARQCFASVKRVYSSFYKREEYIIYIDGYYEKTLDVDNDEQAIDMFWEWIKERESKKIN